MCEKSKRTVFVSTIVMFLLLAGGLGYAGTGAEKLLDSAPEDMIAFMATSGCDEVKPAFDKTIMGKIWNDPGTQSFYKEIKNEILGKIKGEINDPEANKAIAIIENLYKEILKRPVLIGLAEKKTEQGPPFYGFAVIDAGAAKAKISSSLTNLESLADEGDIIEAEIAGVKMHKPDDEDAPLYWGWVGNFLVLGINDEAGMAMKYLRGESARTPQNYLAKVPASGDALVIYYDLEKFLSTLEKFLDSEGELDDFNEMKKVFNALGIDNMKKIKARVGFSGKNLVVDEFVEMPAPRRGLFANLGTVDISMFDMVNENAISTSAANTNLGRIYDTIMSAIKSVASEDYAEIEELIAEFEKKAACKIRSGLLASLAGPAIYYSLPGAVMPEAPMGGGVVIAKLNNKDLWEQSITGLAKFAAKQSEGMIQTGTQQLGGRDVHMYSIMPLMMMQVQPSWTVVGDQLVVASNSALCSKAAEQINSGAKSIRDTDGFKKIASKIPPKPMSVGYVNSQVQFNQTMMSVQQFWPMMTMFASREDLKLPFILPSLGQYASDMEPAYGYTRIESDGISSHFEGSGVEQTIGGVAGAAIGLSIAMTALAQVRQAALRTSSAAHLFSIGKAMLAYSADYEGVFPPNLEILAEKGYIDREMLESKRKPRGFDGPSFIYITGQSGSMSPQNVIVYENPQFCSKDKIAVLFVDCHVQAMDKKEFLEELKATYNRLGREMPEIRYQDD
ncbi:MAG: hypothetical protein ACYTBP_12260 [Planctomycetota bacterium]